MSKRFTLFHLDSERGFRGGERQLLYLASHLRATGHDNIVVCRRGFPLDREAAALGLRRLHLPFLFEFDPLSAWRLARAAAAAETPALVHAHTGHAAGIAALCAAFGGPRWVAHRRVDFPLRGRLSRRCKYDAANRVIAVSGSIRDILVNGGMAAGRITVIADCLPLGKEEARVAGLAAGPMGPAVNGARAVLRRKLAARFDISPGGTWIGNLAALVPHKDQATLLRAAKRVLREHPEARFFLIGDGPLAGELKALARELAVESAVVFTGEQSDPAAWLQALDLYIQSSWGEGMGSVLLEAMACRLPIVATTAGGIPEVVEHGRSALLVPPRSPERLAAAVLECLREPDAAGRRVRAAAAALEAFSLSRIGERTAALYAEVLR